MVTTDSETLLKRLTEIGLNSYEAKIYMALLTGGESTASKLASVAGIPRSRTYDILNSLIRLGLAVEIPDRVKRFRAADPREALLNMLYVKHQIYMKELEEKKSKAKMLSQEISRIIQNDEEGVWRGEGIEVYATAGQIPKRYRSLTFRAAREVLFFEKPPYLQSMTEMTYELPSRGVPTHFLVSEDYVRRAPGAIEAIFRMYGEWEHRKVRDVPVKCGIFDSRSVIITIRNGLNEVRGIVIHDGGVATVMKEVFYRYWERGKPLRPEDVVER